MIIFLLTGLCDHLTQIPGDDIYKLDSSTVTSKFCEKVQVGTNVYIPYRNYQVNTLLSPWFSAGCTAAIVHGKHFFHLYQQNKSSITKVKFRQTSNCCKREFEAGKLAYANKTSV